METNRPLLDDHDHGLRIREVQTQCKIRAQTYLDLPLRQFQANQVVVCALRSTPTRLG